MSMKKLKYLIKTDIFNEQLTENVKGRNENNEEINIKVVTESPLTIFLNNQEIVTLMSISDHPKYLAIGYLLNQNMLKKNDIITKIVHDCEIDVVVVRTKRKTNFEKQLQKKITTSGCAIGTIFGDIYDEIIKTKIKSNRKIKKSWIYQISKKINLTPSLYLKAGAVHGCAIVQKNKPLIYMEDVGRHNAVDKIAGYMFLNKIDPKNKIFYTTGRLTSEMVIKTVKIGVPILISRSGFTSWGVDLAKKTNLTLIGRAKGKKFIVLSSEKRIQND